MLKLLDSPLTCGCGSLSSLTSSDEKLLPFPDGVGQIQKMLGSLQMDQQLPNKAPVTWITQA